MMNMLEWLNNILHNKREASLNLERDDLLEKFNF